MRILLIGEYSRLHNSLKEGLIHHGHEVYIIGIGGDVFKDYPVDVSIDSRLFVSGFPRFFARAVNKLFGLNLFSLERALRFLLNFNKFKEYDVVQLIHENALRTLPRTSIFLLKKLLKHNRKLFLLSCSVDSFNMKYAFAGKFKYSVITPLLESPSEISVKRSYLHYDSYATKPFQKLHAYVVANCSGIIASDMDYHIPLEQHPKYKGLIPNPVNSDAIVELPFEIEGKVRIFHGINKRMYLQKGNRFFEEALAIIETKYPNLVEVQTVVSVPYSTYINLYNNCHILLDQVYSFDQGFNALEAMAKGKVVFTGAETEFLAHYKLEKNKVCINAVPDVDALVQELEALILNHDTLKQISKNARRFIEEHHNIKKVAKQYLTVWTEN